MRLDYGQIVRRLPHRYPFLLVDRVENLVDGERILAWKNVTANEPFFDGHFPGHPIMPGVLICEALVQAGGLLASCSKDGLPAERAVVLAGLEHVRFRRPVVPGDQLRLEVELLHKRRPVVPGDQLRLEVELLHKRRTLWKMKGRALVEDQIAAEAEFLTMEIEAAEMRF